MGRNPKPENEVKTRISIRLKKETIEEIKKRGTLQKVVEEAVLEYLRKK